VRAVPGWGKEEGKKGTGKLFTSKGGGVGAKSLWVGVAAKRLGTQGLKGGVKGRRGSKGGGKRGGGGMGGALSALNWGTALEDYSVAG